MRTFPSEQALVAAYWRKLARSIEKPGLRKRAKLSHSAGRPGVRQHVAAAKHVKPTNS